MLEGENNSINGVGEPLVNGSVQPDGVLVNGDVNGVGEVNPETGEVIQEEKPADDNEEDTGKFKFAPATVSVYQYFAT